MDIIGTIDGSRCGYLAVKHLAKLLGLETTSEDLNSVEYECNELVLERKLVRFQKTTENTIFYGIPGRHPIEGSICLYGKGRGEGSGWAASHAGGMLGDCKIVKGRNYSFAIIAACLALQNAGVTGLVNVVHPDGDKQATFPVFQPPFFGDLRWYEGITEDASVAS
jgi:hypothetical protein